MLNYGQETKMTSFLGIPMPVMTQKAVELAEQGQCPGCYRVGLVEVSAAEGMRFMQCRRCADITVLKSKPQMRD
jgi:hypothetical protein